MALLGEAVADGTSSSLTVSSIPQTHHDLLVLIHGSHVAGSGQQFRTIIFRPNGDPNTVYRFVRVNTDDNGVPTRASGLAATSIQIGEFGDDTDLSSARIHIPSYSYDRNHAVTFDSGGSFGGAAGQSRSVQGWGTWVSNVPITSLLAQMSVENWRAGSTMRVYGIGPLDGSDGSILGPLGEIGYAQDLVGVTGISAATPGVDILSVPVTVGANRRLKLTFFVPSITGSVTGDRFTAYLAEGATLLNNSIRRIQFGSNAETGYLVQAMVSPTAGAHTYKATVGRVSGGTGVVGVNAAANAPIFLSVEDVGPA
jgi:hypothetical protein